MKEDTKRTLQDNYERVVSALIAKGGSACIDELPALTNLTVGQITKAVQYGRRNFDFEHRNIQDYVMASDNGYFLPEDIDQCVAYTAQSLKNILSRAKTIKPLYHHMDENAPDKLSRAMNQTFSDDTDETDPWAVFNSLMNDFKWR